MLLQRQQIRQTTAVAHERRKDRQEHQQAKATLRHDKHDQSTIIGKCERKCEISTTFQRQ